MDTLVPDAVGALAPLGILFDPQKPPASIAKKLALISKEIGGLPKNGWNDHFQYAFIEESAIEDALREKLQAVGLFVFTAPSEITKREVIEKHSKQGTKTSILTDVRVTCLFVDSESGEWIALTGVGTGEDSSDKGTPKAITGAVKYILMKSLRLSTDSDPDRDSEAAKHTGKSNSRTPSQQSIPPCGDCGGVIRPAKLNGKDQGPQVIASVTKEKFGKSICTDCWAKRRTAGDAGKPAPHVESISEGKDRILAPLDSIQWKTSNQTRGNKSIEVRYCVLYLNGGIVAQDWHKSHQEPLARAKKGDLIGVYTTARKKGQALRREVDSLFQIGDRIFENDEKVAEDLEA
jgi:hypothetical protein